MAFIHKAAFQVPRPWSEGEIADLLAQPLCFVLTEAEGFLIGRVVAGEAELLTVAVLPDRQGRGIGLRLVQGFLVEAALRGADSAFLEVAEDNLAARAVYARAGFGQAGFGQAGFGQAGFGQAGSGQAGRRRGYYGAVDALVMIHRMVGFTHPTPNP